MSVKRPYINLTGQRFGRLTVLQLVREPQSKGKKRQSRWRCKCKCGKIVSIRGDCLRYGFTKSCGCLKVETGIKNGRATRTHGETGTPEHAAWAQMKYRCLTKTCREYEEYGGRGIKVCPRWMLYKNFIADMGYKPSIKHSLDRIDNDGDYKPSNCRWASQKVQLANRRWYDRGAHLRGRKHSKAKRAAISRAIKKHWIKRRKHQGGAA